MEKKCTCYVCNAKINSLEAVGNALLADKIHEILVDEYALIHIFDVNEGKFITKEMMGDAMTEYGSHPNFDNLEECVIVCNHCTLKAVSKFFEKQE